MCGIAAIFRYRTGAAPVDARELTAVRDAMAARGPDGFGQWIAEDGTVGLAHRRLAIIDLSDGGRQPLHAHDGRLSITFNGEIYNYRALRAELEQAGSRFQTQTDTEVILELYRRHGTAMLPRLRGMFAFALWDRKRRGLLLARDPFGIKPLYIADDGAGTLRAASQVKALLAGGTIDTTAEPAAHAGFFLWGHVPEPYTLFRGIRSLGSGSWLWVDENGPGEEQRFFDVTGSLAAALEGGRRPAERPGSRERLRTLLLDTVADHLVADVPVGVFLSAGLDSTTLAALAREAGAGRLDTVTLGFEEFAGTANDEVPLAESCARHYGTSHQTHRITARDFEEERAALLAAMDQPTIDGVNVYFVSRAARRSGLKVALSGLGGDELFGGYGHFRTIPRRLKLMGPLAPFAGTLGAGIRRLAAPVLRRVTSPKAAGLMEYGTSVGDGYLLSRALFMPWELPEVLDPDLAAEGWRALDQKRRLHATEAPIGDARLKLSALEMQWYMRNQLLRDADWAGMAHSLEIRVPLVDAALFKSLLPLLAGAGPPGKLDMAASARPQLPAAVLERRKSGFFTPVRNWLAASSGVQDRGLRGWARTVYAHQWHGRR